ncbi:MAG: DUF3325 domain-containing protein [Kiloniellales bacterium]|nr:DUF3325 domain-containing protein [Kiloniellales bacterium]
MTEATALLLAIAGFGALALGMRKHHRELFGAPPSQWRALALHSIGWVLLGLSFVACILDSRWSIGPVLWLGLLTVAALATALTLTYGPRFISWPHCLWRFFLGREGQGPSERSPYTKYGHDL